MKGSVFRLNAVLIGRGGLDGASVTCMIASWKLKRLYSKTEHKRRSLMQTELGACRYLLQRGGSTQAGSLSGTRLSAEFLL